MEVGNDAGRPVLGAGRPEIMFGTADHRLIPVFVHDHVLVVGIRLEPRDHHAAFGEDDVLVHVAAVSGRRIDAFEDINVVVLRRLDFADRCPVFVCGFGQQDAGVLDDSVAGPADAHGGCGVVSRARRDAVQLLGYRQIVDFRRVASHQRGR